MFNEIKKVIKGKIILIILIISILIESVLFIYSLAINKIFESMHIVGNTPVEISKNMTSIGLENNIYYIKVENPDKNKEIYNISLNLKEKNQDVYMRLLFNNDAKFMPKENKDATKFKVYFLSGIKANEFTISFPQNEINIDNVEKITINDNINYLPQIKFYFIRMLIVFTILLIFYLAILFFKVLKNRNIKINEGKMFLYTSLIIGLIFVFINLPQVRYDEHAHFWRAYELSNGQIISSNTHKFPSSIKKIFENSDGTYPNKNMTYSKIKQCLTYNLDKNNEEQMSVGATGSLTPISYVPQTIGVFIGRICNLKPIVILWLGRICNLIAYSIIIYISIKIMPFRKWKKIWMMIGLFPMSLNLASSLSPDAIIISWTLLAISYTMKLKYNQETIKTRQIVILSCTYMIPAICKVVYIPLALLILMIPKEKFINNKKRIESYILSILIVVIPYLVLNKLVKMGSYEIAIRSNVFENLLFTISDPLRTLKTVIYSVYTESSTWTLEMIGGWNTINLISIFILITLILVNFEVDDNSEKYKFIKKDIILILIILIIEILGVIFAMYIGWTQAKETIIDGIQGRYFLPIIPLLFILTSKNKIKININNKDLKLLMATILIYISIFIYTISISL